MKSNLRSWAFVTPSKTMKNCTKNHLVLLALINGLTLMLTDNVMAQPSGYPNYPNQSVSWLVVGTGTETWTTTGVGSQQISVNSFGLGYPYTQEVSFGAPLTGTATLNYYCDSFGSVSDVEVLNSSQTKIYEAYDGGQSGSPVSGSEPFGVTAGNTYYLESYGSADATVSYPATVTTTHTATRSNSGSGSGNVNGSQGQIDIGGFYAQPQPVNGGTISGVSYTLSGDNPNVVLVFSDTGTTTTANANAHIYAKTIAPPSITSSPQSLSIPAGSSANFNVAASGASTLTYQWYFNVSQISGANGTSFTITNTSTTNSGTYSVVVANGVGAVLSVPATLTVSGPPSITIQPTNQNVLVGGTASFSVTASGFAPISYQWRSNSVNLLNATNTTYTIQKVVTNDVASYSVVVTNLAGGVTSSNALLTVLVPPVLKLQFLAGYPLLNLNGMLSNNYVVQYSTNLVDTNWINLLSIPNLSISPYQFLDPAGVVPPTRFYRAVMQ